MIRKIFQRINAIRLKSKKNVKIGYGNKFYRGVLLDNRLGGFIHIGDCNEFLFNVLLLTYGGSIRIGNNCSINPCTIIYGHGGTTIGNNVLIAGQCMLIPANHIFTSTNIPISKQGESRKGIIIEDDVWIGAGCTILDGVTIGKGSIVGAGSVVTKDVCSYTIIAGVPAHFIKNRNEIYQ